MQEAHETATRVLTERRADLETLADGLMEFETLTGDEIVGLLQGVRPVREFGDRPGASCAPRAPPCLRPASRGRSVRRPAGSSRNRRPDCGLRSGKGNSRPRVKRGFFYCSKLRAGRRAFPSPSGRRRADAVGRMRARSGARFDPHRNPSSQGRGERWLRMPSVLRRRHPDDMPAWPRPGSDGQVRQIAGDERRSVEILDLREPELARASVQLAEVRNSPGTARRSPRPSRPSRDGSCARSPR